jgi:hypothetical protein
MAPERLFMRLAPATRPGDAITLPDDRRAVVETVRLADDRRDAKCVVVVRDDQPGDAA